MDKLSLVSVVDDDESVRDSLPDLLTVLGFAAQAFRSGEELLASECRGQTKCLVLDVAMSGMSGLDVQRELIIRKQNIPIAFITGHKDETVRKRAIEEGAAAYLLKPFSETSLLQALRAALNMN